MPGFIFTEDCEPTLQWECGDPIIDDRDEKTYNTIQIGSQCWFSENLNVGERIDGSQNAVNGNGIEKYCYNDVEANCDQFGALYLWDEAMGYTTADGSQGICPEGWHIPTNGEFMTLDNAVGHSSNALKATGTNTSGFSALIAGHRSYDGYFYKLGYDTYFWSSTEYSGFNAYYVRLRISNDNVTLNYVNKNYGFSVRCLKD